MYIHECLLQSNLFQANDVSIDVDIVGSPGVWTLTKISVLEIFIGYDPHMKCLKFKKNIK